VIEGKDILNWCFTLGALNFGVFGFLYTTYAAAFAQVTEDNPFPPHIVRPLKWFCRVLAGVLIILTVLAVVTSYDAGASVSTWIIVLCFVVLAGTAVGLALTMG
jgi:hypothetical protein